MSALENKVFNTINKLNISLRYADDILLLTNSTYEINTVQETIQHNYVLNYTLEISLNDNILFLRLLIDTSNIDRFITPKYIKKTFNINTCTLNFQSEFCCQRTIIKTLISRAKLLSSSQTIFLKKHIKF